MKTIQKWQQIARHTKWIKGCKITESVLQSDDIPSIRRFTATIEGWQGFKVYEGPAGPEVAQKVILRTGYIRDRILRGDENVFYEDKKIVADRSEMMHHISSNYFYVRPPSLLDGCKHLIGTFDKGTQGIFLVNSRTLIHDRKVYKEIAQEAKALKLIGPLRIYGRISTYNGPGMHFVQMDTRNNTILTD